MAEYEANMDAMEERGIALSDSEEAEESGQYEEHLGPVVRRIIGDFEKAKTHRRFEEQRWLKAYRNYRGLYGDDTVFTNTEKSRVFIKVTKTKVLAAYGQLVDVLFANGRFPLTIDPTFIPDGIAENIKIEIDPSQAKGKEEGGTDLPESPYGFPGDGKTMDEILMPPGLKKKFDGQNVTKGTGNTPSSFTVSPANYAAKLMQKKIYDQLDESSASKHFRSSVFECALFGTGIVNGPFAVNKEYPKWDEEGSYDPLVKLMPQMSHVSIWDFYPDPDSNNMDDANYVVRRHKMSRARLRALKARPFFRDSVIDACISSGENYVREWWETALTDNEDQPDINRFEVLEYWGSMELDDLIGEPNLEVPEEWEDYEQLQINAWVCQGRVIRLVLNPFKPSKIPYHAVPYEMNPYSFFGVGVAENMDDTQTLMNGFMRMAVDNAVLSGSLLIEIDEMALTPGQDLDIYPGKIFRRNSGAPGQAIFGTKFPNVSQENLQLFDKARQLADESTGLPSFAHGQTGVTGVGRTASGISMLMGAADGAIKTVVKNMDDYLLKPLGEAFYHFNMQFDYDPEIKGDLEVRARGTESLMANEVRSQRLVQLLQVGGQNPQTAPFLKMGYILGEIAKSLDLDSEKVVNTPVEMAMQAAAAKAAQPPAPPPPPAGGASGGPPSPSAEGQAGNANPSDSSGGGGATMGVGSAPAPGEQGFTG